MYVLGGHQDVVRVGRIAYLMGIKSSVVEWNPVSKKAKLVVRDFFGQDEDWKASGVRPWEIDPVDEVPFTKSIYSKNEKLIELAYHVLSQSDILPADLPFTKDRLMNVHLQTRVLRSLSILCEDTSFFASLCSRKSYHLLLQQILSLASTHIPIRKPSSLKDLEFYALELWKCYFTVMRQEVQVGDIKKPQKEEKKEESNEEKIDIKDDEDIFINTENNTENNTNKKIFKKKQTISIIQNTTKRKL